MEHTPDPIAAIFLARDALLLDAVDAIRHLDATLERHRGNGLGIGRTSVLDHARAARGMAEFQAALERDLDQDAWWRVFDRAGVWLRMDPHTEQRWRETLRQRRMGPLTPEAVERVLAELDANQAAMDEAGLAYVLRRGGAWDQARGQPMCLGSTMTWTLARELSGLSMGAQLGVNFLERRLARLDQQPIPGEGTRAGDVIYHGMRATTGEVRTPYFRAQWFKNANMRLHFTRPDLVARLNQEILQAFPEALPAKRAFPAP